MPDRESCLIDSSVWISAFRAGNTAPWLSELRSLITERKSVINPLIRLELLSGARSEKEFTEIADALDAMKSLELTQDVWHEACRIGFKLGRKGVNVPAADTLIAACAIHYHSVLYHCDRHFHLIARHTLLKEKFLSPAHA